MIKNIKYYIPFVDYPVIRINYNDIKAELDEDLRGKILNMDQKFRLDRFLNDCKTKGYLKLPESSKHFMLGRFFKVPILFTLLYIAIQPGINYMYVVAFSFIYMLYSSTFIVKPNARSFVE